MGLGLARIAVLQRLAAPIEPKPKPPPVHAAARAQRKSVRPGFSCVVVGMDGAVYHWVIKENHRVRENVMKACTYTCAVADDSKSSAEELAPLYAVGSDSRLKCLTGNGPEMTVLEVAPPPPHGAPPRHRAARARWTRTERGGAAQRRARPGLGWLAGAVGDDSDASDALERRWHALLRLGGRHDPLVPHAARGKWRVPRVRRAQQADQPDARVLRRLVPLLGALSQRRSARTAAENARADFRSEQQRRAWRICSRTGLTRLSLW